MRGELDEFGIHQPTIDRLRALQRRLLLRCRQCGAETMSSVQLGDLMQGNATVIPVRPHFCGVATSRDAPVWRRDYLGEHTVSADPPPAQPIRAEMERVRPAPQPAPVIAPEPVQDERPDPTIRFSLLELD